MPNILDEIVANKRNEVDAAKHRLPLDTVILQAQQADQPRDFHSALTCPCPTGIHLIAEIKRKSPSAGLIRPDFDPATIARTYKQAGASAISVLTDETYFDGRLEYIQLVRGVVSLPVLRKDFVIDEYQIYQARAHQADAVLLISEVLGPKRVVEFSRLAATLGMTALIEAYDTTLMQEVLRNLGSPLPANVLIGINNRDLTIQKTDIETTARLAALMTDTSVLVSESGIKTREDVLTVQKAGAHAMLVGETIMKSPDMTAKIKELLGTN